MRWVTGLMIKDQSMMETESSVTGGQTGTEQNLSAEGADRRDRRAEGANQRDRSAEGANRRNRSVEDGIKIARRRRDIFMSWDVLLWVIQEVSYLTSWSIYRTKSLVSWYKINRMLFCMHIPSQNASKIYKNFPAIKLTLNFENLGIAMKIVEKSQTKL